MALTAAVYLIAGAIALSLFAVDNDAGYTPTVQASAVPTVEVVRAARLSKTFTVESYGFVTPPFESVVSAEVAGVIDAVAAAYRVGGLLSKNEIALELNRTDYDTAVDAATAQARQKRAYFESVSKLQSNDYQSDEAIERAAAELALANADLTMAQLDRSRTSVRAPFNGLIVERFANIGEYVTAGQQLFKLLPTDTAEVRLPVTEEEFTSLGVPMMLNGAVEEQVAELDTLIYSTSTKLKDEALHARIVRTEGIIDRDRRVIYVVAEFADPYRLSDANAKRRTLPFGRHVRAEIMGNQPVSALVVPRRAIYKSKFVLVVDRSDRLRFREVDVARVDEQIAYLVSGIDEGELVVTTTLEAPVEGMTVDAQLADSDGLSR